MERDMQMTDRPPIISSQHKPHGGRQHLASRPSALEPSLIVTDRRLRQTATREDELAYRTLVRHLEAEQGLLGTFMLDNRSRQRVSDVLRP